MYDFKYPICNKCGRRMQYIGPEYNKLGRKLIHKYWCGIGHNNRYAYKKGPPPGKYVIHRRLFYTKGDAYV